MEDISIPMLGVSAAISTHTVRSIIQKCFQDLCFSATEEQMNCIFNLVIGKDAFISVPTGSGKSLCYGLLPAVYNKLKANQGVDNSQKNIVVVISPLKSLMQDQVAKFNKMHISATFLDHSAVEEVMSGKYELIFTSPENCLKYQQIFLSDLYQDQLCCIAVDEAHCVEKWLVNRALYSK